MDGAGGETTFLILLVPARQEQRPELIIASRTATVEELALPPGTWPRAVRRGSGRRHEDVGATGRDRAPEREWLHEPSVEVIVVADGDGLAVHDGDRHRRLQHQEQG